MSDTRSSVCFGRYMTVWTGWFPWQQGSWGQLGGPSGADRTQVGPMLAPRTLLSGWPNVCNGTKWMIETYTNDCNWRMVIATAIHSKQNKAFASLHNGSMWNWGIESYSKLSRINIWHYTMQWCRIWTTIIRRIYWVKQEAVLCWWSKKQFSWRSGIDTV